MKKIILFISLAMAGSFCTSLAQGYDPNYKHQAGKTADTTFEYITLNERPGTYHDANYKHQAVKKYNKKKGLSIPTSNKFDGNYKRQFPAR